MLPYILATYTLGIVTGFLCLLVYYPCIVRFAARAAADRVVTYQCRKQIAQEQRMLGDASSEVAKIVVEYTPPEKTEEIAARINQVLRSKRRAA